MKTMKFLFILFATFTFACALTAQKKSIDLVTGYSWQKVHTLELNVGYAIRGESWYLTYQNAYLGSELLLPPDDNPIAGFKGGYTFSMILVGVNFQAIYYTNFSKQQFAFRPEFEITWPGTWSVSYGYNFHMPNNVLNIGYHAFSFRYAFKLKDYSKEDY